MAVHDRNTTNGPIFVIDGGNEKSGFISDTRCLSLNATNSEYLSSTNNIIDVTQDFTMCFWMKTSAMFNRVGWSLGQAGDYSIYGGGYNSQWYIYLSNDGTNVNGAGTHNTGAGITLNTWQFWTMKHEVSTKKFSIKRNDGSYVDITYTGTLNVTSAGLKIGMTNTTGFSDAKWDNLAIYNGKALTESESNILYNSGSGTSFDNADKTNLTSWFSFNEDSGTRIDKMGVNTLTPNNGTIGYDVGKISEPFSFDYVRNMTNGTLGTTINGVSLENTNGVSTRVWNFDGVNDYIDCGDIESVKITGSISIELWVNTSDASGGWVSKSVNGQKFFGGNGNKVYELGVLGSLYWQIEGTGGNSFINYPITSIFDGNFHHVVALWDGTTDTDSLRIYYDGELVQSGTSIVSAIRITTDSLAIGGFSGAGGYPMNGQISQVKIYNKALTASEIKQNYNSMKSRFGIR